MNYFNSLTDKYSLVYSVDMVRINFKLDYQKNEVLASYLQNLADWNISYQVKHYDRFGVFDYRHLFVVACDKWSSTCSIGLERGAKLEDKAYGMIEFNPNKVNGSEFNKLFNSIKLLCKRMELKRYDLAVDFPCIRSLCRLDMSGLKTYELYYENGTYTEYTGVRNKPGRVKLYDKRAESKLDYDLCRVEYTLAADSNLLDLTCVKVSAAQLSLNTDPERENLTSLQSAYVNLLLDVDLPMRNRSLKNLDIRTRKKIEPFLSETALQLDMTCLLACRDFALSYTV